MIPHPAWPVPDVEPERRGDGLVVGCFGVVNSSKRIPELLRAFAHVRERHPGPRCSSSARPPRGSTSTAGSSASASPARAWRARSWVDERRLWALMAGADVCVNLRHPTMGETSGSVIRALSLGKPLVVSDVGWFSELPEGVALRSPWTSARRTTSRPRSSCSSRERTFAPRWGGRVQALARRGARPQRVAERYAAALEEAAGGPAVVDTVLREVSEAAADVGIAPATRRVGARARRAPRRGRSCAVASAASPSGPGSPDRRPLGARPGRLAGGIVAPFIIVDEILWSRSRAGSRTRASRSSGTRPTRGSGSSIRSSSRPPTLAFDGLVDAYAAVKLINAAVMSLAAIPAYFLARRVVGQWLALLAAVLAVAVPSLAYTGTVMTENVFYPLFLVVTLVLVLVLERPTTLRVALLVGLVALAFATRVQAATFVPAILLAPFVLAVLEGLGVRDAIRRYRVLFGGFVALGVLTLLVRVVTGKSPQDPPRRVRAGR